jgi:hypothetical protein
MSIRHVGGHKLVQICHHRFTFLDSPLHGQHISEAIRHTETAGVVGVDLCGPNDGGGNRAGNRLARLV